MNTVESYTMTNPDGKEDACGKFTIEDITMLFSLNDITTVGRKYMFSAWVKSEAEGGLIVNGTYFDTSTEWAKITLQFTAANVDFPLLFTTTGTYYIYHPQLEIGTKATDWTPAPEDVYDSMSAIKAMYDSITLVVTGADGSKAEIMLDDEGKINLTGEVIAQKIFTDLLMAQNLKATNTFEVSNDSWDLVQNDSGITMGILQSKHPTYYSQLALAYGAAFLGAKTGVSLLSGGKVFIDAPGVEITCDTLKAGRPDDDGNLKNVLLEGDIPDYVTEQGTSGVWTYEKWLSGRMRMWAKIDVTDLAIDTEMGALYRSEKAFSKSSNAFPFEFTDLPCVTANYAPSNGYGAMIWWSGRPTTTQLSNCYLVSYQSATTSGVVYVTAEGFWK